MAEPTRSGPVTQGDRPAFVFHALAETYLTLVRAMVADGHVAVREADCVWGRTGVPIADMNRVMTPRLDGERPFAEERAVEIEDCFGGLPHSWWLDDEARPSDLAAIVRWLAPRAQLERVPAMAIPLVPPPPAEVDPAIEVELVARPEDLVAASRLAARGFGISTEAEAELEPLLLRVADPASPVRVVIGRLLGQPAATALGCLAGDVLGIYSVATLPAARRRGLGRAVTLAILRDGAARGARLAVLEASDEGMPVYRRLGFQDAGWFTVVSIAGRS